MMLHGKVSSVMLHGKVSSVLLVHFHANNIKNTHNRV